jgi:hypothetical protein
MSLTFWWSRFDDLYNNNIQIDTHSKSDEHRKWVNEDEQPSAKIMIIKKKYTHTQSLDYILILMNGFMVNYMVSCVNSLWPKKKEAKRNHLAMRGWNECGDSWFFFFALCPSSFLIFHVYTIYYTTLNDSEELGGCRTVMARKFVFRQICWIRKNDRMLW